MNTSGKPREGWMTVIPVSVFIFFVVIALGGPDNFFRTIALWGEDVIKTVGTLLQALVTGAKRRCYGRDANPL